MRPIQLVQRIKCGGASHLPRYFFFPYLTRLCYLPWSSSFQYGWLPKAFLRCLSSSRTTVPVLVPLFSLVFLSICTWIFNHPQTGPIAQRRARITYSHNSPSNLVIVGERIWVMGVFGWEKRKRLSPVVFFPNPPKFNPSKMEGKLEGRRGDGLMELPIYPNPPSHRIWGWFFFFPFFLDRKSVV